MSQLKSKPVELKYRGKLVNLRKLRLHEWNLQYLIVFCFDWYERARAQHNIVNNAIFPTVEIFLHYVLTVLRVSVLFNYFDVYKSMGLNYRGWSPSKLKALGKDVVLPVIIHNAIRMAIAPRRLGKFVLVPHPNIAVTLPLRGDLVLKNQTRIGVSDPIGDPWGIHLYQTVTAVLSQTFNADREMNEIVRGMCHIPGDVVPCNFEIEYDVDSNPCPPEEVDDIYPLLQRMLDGNTVWINPGEARFVRWLDRQNFRPLFESAELWCIPPSSDPDYSTLRDADRILRPIRFTLACRDRFGIRALGVQPQLWFTPNVAWLAVSPVDALAQFVSPSDLMTSSLKTREMDTEERTFELFSRTFLSSWVSNQSPFPTLSYFPEVRAVKVEASYKSKLSEVVVRSTQPVPETNVYQRSRPARGRPRGRQKGRKAQGAKTRPIQDVAEKAPD